MCSLGPISSWAVTKRQNNTSNARLRYDAAIWEPNIPIPSRPCLSWPRCCTCAVILRPRDSKKPQCSAGRWPTPNGTSWARIIRIRLNRCNVWDSSFASPDRPEEAFALFQKTYAAQARLWGPEDPRTLNSLHGLGSAQWTLGHREEALALHLQVLALRLRVQPADHPQVIWTLKDLFMETWQMGRIDDGVQLREQLMDRHERIYGLCDPKLACIVSMMYRTLKDLGRWDCVRMNSGRWLTKLIRQTPEVEGSATDPASQRRRAELLGQLVWQLVTLPEPNGIDVETCVRAAEEAHAVNPDSTHVDNYSRYASARTVLGMVHYRAGAWDKAIATLDRGGEMRDADEGFNQLILAMAHARRGDLLQARAVVR